MSTDEQREAAKKHGFHFYERMAGRADDPAAVVEDVPLTSWHQVISLVKHLRETMHHPDFIAVDLIIDQANRFGSPQFVRVCAAIGTKYKESGKVAGGRMLDALCAEQVLDTSTLPANV